VEGVRDSTHTEESDLLVRKKQIREITVEPLSPKAIFASEMEVIRRSMTPSDWLSDAFAVLEPWLEALPGAKLINLKIEYFPAVADTPTRSATPAKLELQGEGPGYSGKFGSYSCAHRAIVFRGPAVDLTTEALFQEHIKKLLLSKLTVVID
jgi:hypothetical protein